MGEKLRSEATKVLERGMEGLNEAEGEMDCRCFTI